MNIELAKPIRLVIFDVDGVMTNGSLYFDSDGEVIKRFHVHDGLGIQLLHNAGIKTAIITARKVDAVAVRAKALGIEFVYQGSHHKLQAYRELKQQLNLNDHEIAYMGDDLPDIPLLKRAGLAITVPSASAVIKNTADWVTTRHGGDGAVREACELILQAQTKLDSAINEYLKKLESADEV